MTLLVLSLILATSLPAPMPAQQPSLDVVQQARAILTAIAGSDFAEVEKQFTDDMKAALPPGTLAAIWGKRLGRRDAPRTKTMEG